MKSWSEPIRSYRDSWTLKRSDMSPEKMPTRKETINALKGYFKVRELVCDHTYNKWGEQSWQFLDTEWLQTLLVLRKDILQTGMICNNSSMHQRGLRCNMCNLVSTKQRVYLSAHVLGKAGDFTVVGMTADEARKKVVERAELLPYPVRMEEGVSWLHIDVLPVSDNKITFFTD